MFEIDKKMRELYKQFYGKNLPNAKFSIGDNVSFRKNNTFYKGIVEGVNLVDKMFEYLVSSVPVLAWENELEKT